MNDGSTARRCRDCWRSSLTVAAACVRQEDAAGRAAAAAAAAGRRARRRAAAAGAARAGRRADDRAARAGARRRDRVGVARRSEPQLAAQAGVLRARQQRARARPAQKALDENAALLKRYPTWTVTIEGHCDERGTAEYNLALGERRAVAARAYLVSLGIPADRLRTVSYGKEFPFDPGHDEAAFAKNRRAHFVITAK